MCYNCSTVSLGGKECIKIEVMEKTGLVLKMGRGWKCGKAFGTY